MKNPQGFIISKSGALGMSTYSDNSSCILRYIRLKYSAILGYKFVVCLCVIVSSRKKYFFLIRNHILEFIINNNFKMSEKKVKRREFYIYRLLCM